MSFLGDKYNDLTGVLDVGGIKEEYLNSIYAELAQMVGIEGTIQIYSSYKGQQITFPTKLFSKEYITKQVENEYNGRNVKQLSKKYGFSERWIREILKQKEKEENVL